MHRSSRLAVASLILLLIPEYLTAPTAAGRTIAGGLLDLVAHQKRDPHISSDSLPSTRQEIRELK